MAGGMRGAEEGWFAIDAVEAKHDGRRLALGAWPIQRRIAGEDADGGPPRGTFSNSQELPSKRGRRAEVVVVFERAGSGERGDRRPLADLMPPDAERAQVAAALQPLRAQERVQLL